MITVSVKRVLPFPAEKVWGVFGDFGNRGWAGYPKIEMIGEGIGMIRRLHFDGYEPIDEVLEYYDEASMTFVYTVHDMPLPIVDYRSTVQISAEDDGSALVEWSCVCSPEDKSMTADKINRMIRKTYEPKLDLLHEHLNTL